MKHLKKYQEYLSEDFVEFGSPMNKLQSLMEGKAKLIKEWFQKGLFTGSELLDIDITNFGKSLNKSIIFNFVDDSYQYQVILTLRVQDYQKGKIGKGFLQIKKYTFNDAEETLQGQLLDTWDSNNVDNDQDGNPDGQIELKDFSPEFILDKISKMSDQSQALGTKEKSEAEESPEEYTTGENLGLQGEEEPTAEF